MKIVIDTNVLLAGLSSNRGRSFTLLQHIDIPQIELQLSVPVFLEYEKILKDKLVPKIFSKKDIDSFLNYLCKISTERKIYYLWRPLLKDPHDDMILELAVSANAKYIVTYNTKDFLPALNFGIKIIKPYEFLNKIGVIK